jgi:hypothetical protein
VIKSSGAFEPRVVVGKLSNELHVLGLAEASLHGVATGAGLANREVDSLSLAQRAVSRSHDGTEVHEQVTVGVGNHPSAAPAEPPTHRAVGTDGLGGGRMIGKSPKCPPGLWRR